MEHVTKSERKLKNWAAFLGFIQGLAWTLLSAVFIAFHYSSTKKELASFETYMEAVVFFIYGLFIKDDFFLTFYNPTMTDKLFHIVSIVYLLLNLIWVFVSVNVFIGRVSLSCSLKLWSAVTLLICVLDFVVAVVLGTDYHKCVHSSKNYFENQLLDGAVCANGILPVLFIAAKGFVLWIVNVIFAFMLITITPQKQSPPPKHLTYNNQRLNSDPQYQITPSSPILPVSHFPSSPIYATPYEPNKSPRHNTGRSSLQIPTTSEQSRDRFSLQTPTILQQSRGRSPLRSPTNAQQSRGRSSPRTPTTPSRSWKVYSSNFNDNRTRRSHSDNVDKHNLRSGGQILSNRTEKPFVLHSPPRRF